MKKFFVIIAVLLLFGTGVLVGGYFWPPTWLSASSTAMTTDTSESAERKPLFYRHPMNPAISSPVPAKDDMGMDYIPVYADENEDATGEDADLIRISPVVVNNLGVRTEKVTRSTLTRRIDTVGYIDYDERLISHVHLRIEGWVEDLRVKAVGERVRRGDLLFRLYSPELVNAQEEYLQAIRMDNSNLLAAARNRLRALGVPEDLIESLNRTPEARQLSAVYARQDGVVAELDIREGMYVGPTTQVMALADLASIWVLVDVFENQADWVAAGQKAEVQLPYLLDQIWQGEVEYVYPVLDPKTRTLKVRLRFPNPGERLKPNMYANVTIHADPRDNVLNIPQQALIRTGTNQRVIVARGEGRFEAVTVETGIESGDRIEIVAGLEEGDPVVVSAQFLIDSEASLQAALRRMTEPQDAEPPAIWGEGIVNAIQAEVPQINLQHAPIPALGWPEMAMDIPVAQTVDLSRLETGNKIRFALEPGESGYTITQIEPAE